MDQRAPFRGPAPDPTRGIDLPGVSNPSEVIYDTLTGQTHLPQDANFGGFGGSGISPTGEDDINVGYKPEVEVDQRGLNFGDGTFNPGQIETGQAPLQPDLASEVAELRTQVGKLVNALGSERERNTLREEELKLEMSLNGMLAAQPQAQAAQAAGPAFDPDKELKQGEFMDAMRNWYPVVQGGAVAQATRMLWDVTPQEELEAVNRYPQLQHTPEPLRTQKTLEAVQILRRARAPRASAGQAQTGQAAQGSNGAQQTRSLEGQRVVPMAEASSVAPPSSLPAGAGSGESQAIRLRAQYEAAKQLKDPKQRIAQMRAIWQQMQRLAQVSDRQIMGSQWVNRS